MKRKLATLIVLVVCCSLVLTACSPRLIGETKAKEAGLAFINDVFDVNETEATVEYSEYSIEQDTDSENTEQKSAALIMRCYTVTVTDKTTGETYYTAEVNATTGVAYRADRGAGTLSPLTEEQLEQAKELSQLSWGEEKMLNRLYESKPAQIVYEWAAARFEKQSEVMSVEYGSMEGDFNGTHRVYMDCLVMFVNGAVYIVNITWPTLEIDRVEILSQPVNKGAAS